MKSFDLHCDTITKCCEKSIGIRENNLHFDLKRAATLGEHTQVFAIWIPDQFRGREAVDYFNKNAEYFYNEIEKNKDLISLYKSDSQTPVKAILALEGGSGCGGTIDGLYNLYEKGVKLITLTWNGENEIGGGALSEGRLTDFGKQFIKEAEQLGIILDASHLNKQTFYDFCEVSQKPFVASHSNYDIVNNPYGQKRNLTKDQIEIIKERRGIIGINYYTKFIEDENATGFEAVERQVYAFLESGWEDLIALGSDYDGCQINPVLNDVMKLKDLYLWLKSKGYSEDVLDKMFYKNAEKFFEA